MTLDSFDAALFAREVFRESNRVRERHQLPKLRADPRLDAAADEQATMMALQAHIDHRNPRPGLDRAIDRVLHQGVETQLVIENVARTNLRERVDDGWRRRTYAQLAAVLVQQWMDSPPHRASLLHREITHLGVAAHASLIPPTQEDVFAAQVFARLELER
ncbi:MAG: CAP domain-containing protein [Opitutus sp.]|nr:CAP domain-containing protein [Opitutus sp.]